MRQSTDNFSSSIFLERIPAAIDRAARDLTNRDFTMVPAIARDTETIRLIEFLQDDAAVIDDERQKQGWTEIQRENINKAVLVEIGIRAGAELALTPASEAVSPWAYRGAMAVALLAAAFLWLLCSDSWPLWRILAALALSAGIGGLAFSLGRKTARQLSLQTSGEI